MPTTTTYRRDIDASIRMQQRALRLLNEVHRGACRPDPLMWQLGACGIAGSLSSFGNPAVEVTFRAWAKLLGLTVQTKQFPDNQRLYAMATDYGTARTDLSISVDLWPTN